MKKAPAISLVLGFRVKSGWAATALLAGPDDSPRLLAHRPIDLCDPEVAESRQPYHAAMGQLETNSITIKKRVTIIRKAAARSVSALLDACRHIAGPVGTAAIVVGSDIDPAAIATPHIRAHALEGRLFRTVLEDSLVAGGVKCHVIVEKNLLATAISELASTESQLKHKLNALGRSLPGPWRADSKAAALAAWLAVHSGARQKTKR